VKKSGNRNAGEYAKVAMAEQEALLELPEQPVTATVKVKPAAECKLRAVNRDQLTMAQIDVEHLIDEHHPARGIWEVTKGLDLSRYESAIRTRKGEAGRAAWPPQLLIGVWLYGYSQGITSARELERKMEYEPGLMWLTGMEVINHHTLSDFRVGHGEPLTNLFAQMLVVLSDAGLVKMRLVAHDGTKIRAQAGVDSFRREATLREKLEQARKLVEEDPQADGGNKRQQAAQQRARRERMERTESALKQLNKIQAKLTDAEQRDRVRVSLSEAEARKMKHGDHAIAPSYNAQVSTDADSGVIVGVHLSQSGEDSHGLKPAIEEIHNNLGRMPEQMVADGGFTNRESIQMMAEGEIDFYGSLRDPKERSEAAMKSCGIDPKFAPHFFILQAGTRTVQCPAGKQMKYLRRHQKRGDYYESYRASGADCVACAFQKQCCPGNAVKGRIVSFRDQEVKQIAEFRKKMASDEGQLIYKQRGAAAEFPFAWIKERMKLRKFRLFGLRKASIEVLWATLAYNVMIWIRARRQGITDVGVQPISA
jgi:transposase